MKIFYAIILVPALLCGCKCSVDRPAQTESVFEVPVEDVDEVEPIEEHGATYEEIEEFYRTLPELSLPTGSDGIEFEMLAEVPERIYKSAMFGIEYTCSLFLAARLPENDGLRFIITSIEEGSDYVWMYLHTYSAQKMQKLDELYIYGVRELDGGQNVLVKHFTIGADMGITLKSDFYGNGEEGQHTYILFERRYFTPLPDGLIRETPDEQHDTITYAEEEIEIDGEYYGTYRFTVTSYEPVYNAEAEVWEKQQKITRYMINDESWLVEVDAFPEKDNDDE